MKVRVVKGLKSSIDTPQQTFEITLHHKSKKVLLKNENKFQICNDAVEGTCPAKLRLF